MFFHLADAFLCNDCAAGPGNSVPG
ncbi:hypothetical protein GTQ45_07615 [Pyruvatibacter mobilis]|uniref:Uncharacterized protein n=1 Tax=Pyruvatibacter mobilis TaxID=1712261 RepID=A0A845QBQ7_9HYPH|nr:hypothetical protein [Pyruvatibacter mobilis]QJD76820.1 hypothetical protein HG718_07865 [Pyruvatibacter mobilis]